MSATDRLPLSRDRIAAAALELGDAEGLEAMSMRRVGSALGVEAMSLYNHVSNKDALLDAIGDLLYEQVLEAYSSNPDVSWQENARHLVAAFYNVAMEHPNMVSLMLDRPIQSITKVTFLHQCYDVFVTAGYPVREAALAFNTVSSWMTGVVRSEIVLMPALLDSGVPFTRDDVPEEFHGVITFMECCQAWTAEERFRSSFDTLLAGFEKELADKGW